jgi:hypothetical protein
MQRYNTSPSFHFCFVLLSQCCLLIMLATATSASMSTLTYKPSGGIALDLSWMHLRPLHNGIGTGFRMQTVCLSPDQTPTRTYTAIPPPADPAHPDFYSATIPQDSIDSLRYSASLPSDRSPCYTSFVLAMRETDQKPQEYRDILQCVLR